MNERKGKRIKVGKRSNKEKVERKEERKNERRRVKNGWKDN